MIAQAQYNVGIYARLSRDDERAGESVSIENQREMLSRHVKEQGWNLVSTYVDDGWSGTNFERPNFNRMIADATDGKINLILCKDLSRFGRDYIEVGKYTDYVFPSIGCRFIAVNDGVDTISKNNDMLMIFKNVLNDVYARDTSNKIKAVRQSTCKTGKFIGAAAPYGYLKSPEDHHKLIVDEVAAPVVRRIFELRCSGYGFRKIASVLNTDGITPPRDYYYETIGKPNPRYLNHLWNDVTIRVLLRNEVYIGNMVQNKTGNLSYKQKKTINKPKEEWIKVEGTHEPIIDMETWQRTVELGNKPSKPRSTAGGEISLFSGLLYYLDCRFAMKFNQETHRRKDGSVVKYTGYICGNYSRSGKSACSVNTIYIKALSEIIIADIRQKAELIDCDESHVLERISEMYSAANTGQLAALRKSLNTDRARLQELDRLIQSLYEDKVKGTIPEAVCVELMGKYEAERKEKAQSIETATQSLDGFQSRQEDIQSWMKVIREFRNIEALDRDILMKLIDKIEIGEREIIGNQKQREVRIHYRFVGYVG